MKGIMKSSQKAYKQFINLNLGSKKDDLITKVIAQSTSEEAHKASLI
jgi:hypothetical protein